MKIIGFDYDGTIINIEPEKAHAFGKLLNSRWNVNEKAAEAFWIETGGSPRRYKFDYFYNKQFATDLTDADYKIIEEEFSEILKTQFYPKVSLLPGALELLKFAGEKFDYAFISSGVTHNEINYLVKLNGIDSFFDAIYGTNKDYLSKRDHFSKVMKEFKPERKIFIGDGEEDMRIAREFGFTAIGIPTNHNEEKLKIAGASYVIGLTGCIKLINKLLQ